MKNILNIWWLLFSIVSAVGLYYLYPYLMTSVTMAVSGITMVTSYVVFMIKADSLSLDCVKNKTIKDAINDDLKSAERGKSVLFYMTVFCVAFMPIFLNIICGVEGLRYCIMIDFFMMVYSIISFVVGSCNLNTLKENIEEELKRKEEQ